MDYSHKTAANLGKALDNIAEAKHQYNDKHIDQDLAYTISTSKFLKTIEREDFNLQDLRKLSWAGIPQPLRHIVWLTLLGILPTQKSKRYAVLDKRRKEYLSFVEQYHHNNLDESDLTPVMKQIKLQVGICAKGDNHVSSFN
jgi:hypothetical protein